jgi:cytosine/adenosine deaminase-related metal-dependent hydrolase
MFSIRAVLACGNAIGSSIAAVVAGEAIAGAERTASEQILHAVGTGSSIAAVVAGKAIAGAECTASKQRLVLASTCFMQQSCSESTQQRLLRVWEQQPTLI